MSAWDYASEEEEDEGRDAYPPTDPKHPDYVSMWANWADQERKRAKEEGLDAA